MATDTGRTFSPAQQRVFDSMVELLRRAGLEYSGGYIHAGGYRIHYLDYGSGPTVLLIHGGGAGSAVWFRQIAALSRKFRVIVPDAPIFGLSSQPADAQDLLNITTGFIRSFMDVMEIDSAAMAGLSMGGFAAARFAAANPERVSHLALVDSAGFGRDLPWGFRLSSLPVFGFVLTHPQRWLHERFFAATEVVNADAEHNDAYLDYSYHVTATDGHWLAVRRNMPVFAGIRGQRNLLSSRELKSISSETLVLWGRQDRFFPLSHALHAVNLVPNSRLEVLENCGHIALLDQPEQVSGHLLRFFSNSSETESVAD